MAVTVIGTGSGAPDGMFSAGDAYERFMGRWSRERLKTTRTANEHCWVAVVSDSFPPFPLVSTT